ncbi:MAG: PAS domain S-box protein [Methanothrix sp.]|nr:PAS domain S-box protein [Methanothrix sp.]MCX8207579.1 PAS domain S-box protein [Methanothrix sp.]
MPSAKIDSELSSQILDSIGQGVVVSRVVDGRWVIEYANPTFASMVDLPVDEIVGRSLEEFVHPEDITRIQEGRARRLRGITDSYEVRIRQRDGSTLPVLLTGAPRLDGDKIVGSIAVLTDLRQQYSVLKQLENSERMLVDILEFMPDPVVGIDLDGRVIIWNKAMEELTGVKKDQMLGKGDYEYAIPFYGYRRPILVDLALRGYDEAVAENYRILRREGRVITAEVFLPNFGQGGSYLWGKAAPVHGADGTIEGAVEVIRDITENVNRLKDLDLSEKRYRSIVEDMPFLVCRFDRDGILTFVNDNYCRYFGFRREEILGRPFLELIPEEEREAVRKRFSGLTPERPYVKYIHRVKKGEEIRWQRWTDRAIFSQNGDVIEYQSIGEDITEEKRTEDALRESEHRFRVLTETTSSGIAIIRDGRVVYVNRAGRELCGYTMDELKGASMWMVVHPEDVARLRELYEREMRGEQIPSRYELRFVTKDGDVRWVECTHGTIDLSGGRAMLCTAVDITERKRAEEELQRIKDSLEQIVRDRTEEMERFVYTISHDLRSPLITISGLAGFAELDLSRGDVEKVKEGLRKITQSAEKMDALLSDLLELSRIGRIVNPPEDVPFGILVEDAIEQLAGKIKMRGAEIRVADGMPAVHVDRMRLVEALVNLIDNSIKYTPGDKRPLIEIFCRDGVFCVKDNGIGIPENQRDKVFELFYKVDPKSDGTGVGLTIVKRIIEVHGGRIWVESDGCSWTAFCFTLPVVAM